MRAGGGPGDVCKLESRFVGLPAPRRDRIHPERRQAVVLEEAKKKFRLSVDGVPDGVADAAVNEQLGRRPGVAQSAEEAERAVGGDGPVPVPVVEVGRDRGDGRRPFRVGVAAERRTAAKRPARARSARSKSAASARPKSAASARSSADAPAFGGPRSRTGLSMKMIPGSGPDGSGDTAGDIGANAVIAAARQPEREMSARGDLMQTTIRENGSRGNPKRVTRVDQKPNSRRGRRLFSSGYGW